MYAPRSLRIFIVISVITACGTTEEKEQIPPQDDLKMKNVDLFDGVSVKIPERNDTGRVMSIEVNTNNGVVTGIYNFCNFFVIFG